MRYVFVTSVLADGQIKITGSPGTLSVLRRPGGYSEEVTPDPIPNSAVKILSADGTSS